MYVDDLSKAHDHEYGVVRRDPGHRVSRPIAVGRL